MEVNRQPVTSPPDLRRKASAAKDRLVLLVHREGATAYLATRD